MFNICIYLFILQQFLEYLISVIIVVIIQIELTAVFN